MIVDSILPGRSEGEQPIRVKTKARGMKIKVRDRFFMTVTSIKLNNKRKT